MSIFSILVILIFGTSMLILQYQSVSASTIIVPDNYSTIQEAINHAGDGDTVFVRAATYNENVILNVSISLIGESRETAIIDVRGIGNPLEITVNGTIVSGFTLSYGGTGIAMTNSHNNLIENNILRKNSRGIGGSFYTNTILENNTVTENDYGIDFGHLSGPSSKNNTARNNEIHSNTNAGIYVSASEGNNSIVGNSIHGNVFGIVLDHTQNNEVSGNLINSNTYGIYMRNAIQDTIVQNQLQGNVVGIHLENSNGNAMFHNNFVSNTVQVEGASYNTWDDGYHSGGNYWSDYLTRYPNATEIDASGIGDTAYIIDVDNTDRYPLMTQYTIPEFPSFLILPLFMVATLLAIIVYKRKYILDNSAVHLSEMSNPNM
jgi:parallel beta-helix repeat protein